MFGDFLPKIYLREYIPVPGILVFIYTPFLPTVTFAPLGPNDVLTPDLLKFRLIPGAILTRLRKDTMIIPSLIVQI